MHGLKHSQGCVKRPNHCSRKSPRLQALHCDAQQCTSQIIGRPSVGIPVFLKQTGVQSTGWSSPRSPGGERNTGLVRSTSSHKYAGSVSLAERTSLTILITLKTPSLVSLRLIILGAPVTRLTIAFHVSILCIFCEGGEGGIYPKFSKRISHEPGVVSLEEAGNGSSDNRESGERRSRGPLGPGCRKAWDILQTTRP